MDGANNEDYLFGKGEPWYIIGAAIFAANIGSEHLVGLAGTGAKSGVGNGSLGDAKLDDTYFGLALCSVLPVDEHQAGQNHHHARLPEKNATHPVLVHGTLSTHLSHMY